MIMSSHRDTTHADPSNGARDSADVSTLAMTIKHGSVSMIRAALGGGTDIAVTDEAGCPVIEHAFKRADAYRLARIRMLIEHDARAVMECIKNAAPEVKEQFKEIWSNAIDLEKVAHVNPDATKEGELARLLDAMGPVRKTAIYRVFHEWFGSEPFIVKWLSSADRMINDIMMVLSTKLPDNEETAVRGLLGLLIHYPAYSINDVTANEESLIGMVVDRKSIKLLKTVLMLGADITQSDCHGPAVESAFFRPDGDQPERIRMLIEHDARAVMGCIENATPKVKEHIKMVWSNAIDFEEPTSASIDEGIRPNAVDNEEPTGVQACVRSLEELDPNRKAACLKILNEWYGISSLTPEWYNLDAHMPTVHLQVCLPQQANEEVEMCMVIKSILRYPKQGIDSVVDQDENSFVGTVIKTRSVRMLKSVLSLGASISKRDRRGPIIKHAFEHGGSDQMARIHALIEHNVDAVRKYIEHPDRITKARRQLTWIRATGCPEAQRLIVQTVVLSKETIDRLLDALTSSEKRVIRRIVKEWFDVSDITPEWWHLPPHDRDCLDHIRHPDTCEVTVMRGILKHMIMHAEHPIDRLGGSYCIPDTVVGCKRSTRMFLAAIELCSSVTPIVINHALKLNKKGEPAPLQLLFARHPDKMAEYLAEQ